MTQASPIDLSRVRSVLCVPADDEDRVRKARGRGADLVMFDLEDGVAPDRRFIAREILHRHIDSDVAIRIYRWSEDIDLARRAGLIFVPKVDFCGRLPIDLNLILCLEAPWSILNVLPWLWMHRPSNVVGLAFGRADFTSTVRPGAWDLVDRAAMDVAVAAAALGIHASDAPCYTLDDPDTLTAEVARSRRQGFHSKGCFCPSQIEAVNAGMRPSPAEIEAAQAILASRAAGIKRTAAGVVSPPVLALAERIVAA